VTRPRGAGRQEVAQAGGIAGDDGAGGALGNGQVQVRLGDGREAGLAPRRAHCSQSLTATSAAPVCFVGIFRCMSSQRGTPFNDALRLGQDAMRRLRARSVCAFEAGLTDAEFDRIEAQFGFRFADDHRAFLGTALPINVPPEPLPPGTIRTHPAPWPNWRHGDHTELQERLDWPVLGVLFDVEHNFWHHTWGPRPDDPATALDVARHHLAHVPRMVPVYGHRYLPAGPGMAGHPVLSMWQTDVIYYGLDVADYINTEFGDADRRRDADSWNPVATVPFWRDLL
jgi:hypothetical protein